MGLISKGSKRVGAISLFYHPISSTTVLTTTLPVLSAQFEDLKPRFQQIDRLEGLVHRVGQDMDVMGE